MLRFLIRGCLDGVRKRIENLYESRSYLKVKLWSPDCISVGDSLKGARALQKKDARLDRKLALSDAENAETR